MKPYWLPWLLGGVLILWVLSLVAVRQWTKRRLRRRRPEEDRERPEDLAISLPDPRPEDQAALEVIRAHRRRFLLNLWPDTQLSFAAVNDLSLAVIKEVARVYYPGEERPELKASLADLVALHNRVGARLRAWLETLPLRAIKDVELETWLQYHEIYRTVTSHPGYLVLKRYHLDKAVRFAWAVKNYANPWYWGSKAAYTGGKEAFGRLFLARVAAVVGEEAMRLYGRRPSPARVRKCYQVAVQEMINLALEDGRLTPETANYILRFILKARELEDQDRLALLARLARPRPQEAAGINALEQSERDRLGRWLKQMITANWPEAERRQRLGQIQPLLAKED